MFLQFKPEEIGHQSAKDHGVNYPKRLASDSNCMGLRGATPNKSSHGKMRGFILDFGGGRVGGGDEEFALNFIIFCPRS